MAAGLLVILTLLATVHPAKSQLNSPASEILPSVLWQEVLHSQSHFQLSLCAEIFVLKLVPSLNDVVSDFLVADSYSSSNDSLAHTLITFYSYGSICAPLFHITFSLLFYKLKSHRKVLTWAYFVPFLCFVVALDFYTTVYSFTTMPFDPQVLFLPAACVATILLSTKVLAALVHGPTTQRLTRIVAPYEGRAECLHQLIIAMFMLMSGRVGTREWKPYYALVTSFLILGRDVAEQLLSLGPDLLAGKSLGERYGAIGRLLPSILCTAVFRIGSIALISCSVLTKKGPPIVFWVTVIYAPPLVFIVFLKRRVVSIQKLSSYDILQGMTDEWSSCAVWGNLDRQAARIPQLVAQGHFFLVFGSFCLWKIVSPITDQSADVRVFAVCLLCMGIFSVTLFLSDIFYMEVDSQDSPETGAGPNDLELLRDTTMERCRTPPRRRRSDTRPEMAWPGLSSL